MNEQFRALIKRDGWRYAVDLQAYSGIGVDRLLYKDGFRSIGWYRRWTLRRARRLARRLLAEQRAAQVELYPTVEVVE